MSILPLGRKLEQILFTIFFPEREEDDRSSPPSQQTTFDVDK